MKPKLFTTPTVAEVATRWKQQYFQGGEWMNTVGGTSKNTYHKLIMLSIGATIVDINKAIGNGSWTELICDGCDKPVDKLVQVGKKPDYESATALLCEKCVREALALFDEKKLP